MLTLNSIIEFSQINCLAICSVLVPINLLASLQSIIFTALRRPQKDINVMALFASFYALMIILHVGTWFIVGVVRIETFVLLSFASCCLIVNIWSVSHGSSLRAIIQFLQQQFAKIPEFFTAQNQGISPETK
ncbi:MAG: hypothetical protein QNJ68_22500 [Microcoleaceae cyanobacterium MO_207.B10]|nr:hypothetical protein [Microcoleaceae cyanobacterium MO_207.B10]